MTSKIKDYDYREDHCFFKKLDETGRRCIAYCHWVINYGCDCIGNKTGIKTLGGREKPLNKSLKL
jgi:hypothetical protein